MLSSGESQGKAGLILVGACRDSTFVAPGTVFEASLALPLPPSRPRHCDRRWHRVSTVRLPRASSCSCSMGSINWKTARLRGELDEAGSVAGSRPATEPAQS